MTSRARVFISCGQRDDFGETDVASGIAEALAREGFEPYVAARQQTLKGLKENVFNQLAQSEYIVFVDFRRERLEGTDPPQHRGSVFAQQELAIAASRDVEVIALQEKGIRPLDGVLRFMQANCLTFSDRDALPSKVLDLVRSRGWTTDWRNQLVVDPTPGVVRRVRRMPENVIGDFHYITIRNEHRDRLATNVYAYLQAVRDVRSGRSLEYEATELKWAGYVLPNATIHPHGYRRLDAVWIRHDRPTQPQFNCFADCGIFVPGIEGPGEWLLEYTVVCESIPGATRTFKLSLDGTVTGVTLSPVQTETGTNP